MVQWKMQNPHTSYSKIKKQYNLTRRITLKLGHMSHRQPMVCNPWKRPSGIKTIKLFILGCNTLLHPKPVLEWPSKKESKTTVDSKNLGRIIRTKITCVTKNTKLAIHALDQVHCWDAYFRLRIGHYENFTPLNFQPLLFSKQ
jgi:hypothetical protein